MKYLDYTVVNQIAEIGLNHGPVNALDEAMVDELIEALNMANCDCSVRCILLFSHIPNRFCAGLDLKKLFQNTPEQRRSLLTKLYIKLYDAQFNLTKPSITVVSGAVRGGGMTVAISSDMILSDRNANFGYSEIDVGVLPAIHFSHLHRIVGKYKAFEILFGGRIFSAQEAERLGLINDLFDSSDLMKRARAMATRFAAKPATVMAMGRQAFVNATDNEYRRGIASAVEYFCNVCTLEQAQEGMQAFLEKREPKWEA